MSTSACHSQLTLTSTDPEKFRNPPWWNRRTRLERTLCCVTVTSLLMLSVMAVALAVFGYLYQRNLDRCLRRAVAKPDAERLQRAGHSLPDDSLSPNPEFTLSRSWQNDSVLEMKLTVKLKRKDGMTRRGCSRYWHCCREAKQQIYFPSSADRLIAPNETSQNICLTPGCIKAAAAVLSNIDESVDPCQNFYQFACGGWLDRHAIPEDKTSMSVFSVVQDELNTKLRVLLEKPLTGSEPDFIKMIKEMFDTCLDLKNIEKEGAKPLENILHSLGGWPVVEGSKWNESAFDWIDTLIRFRQIGYSHDILMDLSVTVDYRNNTYHIVDVDQTSLGMPDRTYLLRGLNDSSTAAYFKLMINTATMLGADKDVAEEQLMKSLDFEIALANFSLAREERRNISRLYNKYTVRQLEALTPQINWMKYFNGLLNDEITEDDSVIVGVPDFVLNFAQLITNTDKRVVANYMMWRVVGQSLSMLSKVWRNMAQEYSAVITGKSLEEPRWEQCLSSLTGSLGVSLSSYYVRHYFKEDSKDRALEMVSYIHKEFLKILDDIDWMHDTTKDHAKEKAKSIKTYIGYPAELLNDSKVSELYVNLTLTDKSYFDNILKVRRWSTDYAFSQLRKRNEKGDWKKHARAAVVNAYYNSIENSIEFPAGILQNAFFNKDRPHYMNFGAIGFVIGHEITHGFDDRGRQFDKDGNNVNWWDQETDNQFRKKAQCIIDQYSNYTVAENGLKVNGFNTQGENIADNGGVKEAYRAYHTWIKDHGAEPILPGLKYSPRQLFWISAANVWCGKYRPEVLKLRIISGVHSPPKFRVTGPLSNLNEFSEDFHCPLGSPMNPHQKCQIW